MTRRKPPFGKTARVLTENVSGQGKRRAFWRKMRRGKENAARFGRKCVWARKTARVLAENACGWGKPFRVEAAFTLGRRHPGGFLKKMRRDEKNLFRWRPLSCWGSSTRAGFDGKCAGALSRVFAVDFLNLVKEFRAAFSASTLRAEDF